MSSSSPSQHISRWNLVEHSPSILHAPVFCIHVNQASPHKDIRLATTLNDISSQISLAELLGYQNGIWHKIFPYTVFTQCLTLILLLQQLLPSTEYQMLQWVNTSPKLQNQCPWCLKKYSAGNEQTNIHHFQKYNPTIHSCIFDKPKLSLTFQTIISTPILNIQKFFLQFPYSDALQSSSHSLMHFHWLSHSTTSTF
jgi:hypothetical protein